MANSSNNKTKVAVLFGGRSPEHDVSIVTGLQALQALDQAKFDAFPVYIAGDGEWLLGDALREQAVYIPGEARRNELMSVVLDVKPSPDGRGKLVSRKPSGLLGRPKVVDFDIALLAFHGPLGEDGRIQGLFEIANVPYTGMRPLASTVFMDKAATKVMLGSAGISLLPHAIVQKPVGGTMPTAEHLKTTVGNIDFPMVAKPLHLGSSIGVARVETMSELRGALSNIFLLDSLAIVEPFVPNLVEYNVAVRQTSRGVRTSAIERPKSEKLLLDFKTKYLSGASGSGPVKQMGSVNRGLLSLTRDISPEMDVRMASTIRLWAEAAFSVVRGTGIPRIDFLCDAKTGKLWLNEVNPCPGSFGFFLWEAAPDPILFTDLLECLITEGLSQRELIQTSRDPTPAEGRLFQR